MACERVVVIGNTCAGKSTFASEIASALGLRLVELDALFWKPNWQKCEPAEFRAKIAEATQGTGWVVAGNYSKSRELTWRRADYIVWLDIGLLRVLRRVVQRSYGRWRTQELLWGTNRENFASHLKLWNPDESLLSWAVRSHYTRRREYAAHMNDERWSQAQFHRFRSNEEARAWLSTLSRSGNPESQREP